MLGMRPELLFSVLFSLFDLAREDRPAHVGNVASRIGESRSEVARALRHLERRGLCDAGRCRLTLHGLAVASGLRAAGLERTARIAHAA